MYREMSPMYWKGAVCTTDPHPEAWSDIRTEAQTEYAKAKCRTCDFLIRCQEWAINKPEPTCIWGGLDEDERDSERRRRNRKSRAAAA